MASTILQGLNHTINGTWVDTTKSNQNNSYNIAANDIIIKTKSKEEYEKAKLEAKQQKLLNHQWVKAGNDVQIDNLAGLTWIKAMCRDADLMDQMPEIATALNSFMDESCTLSNKGKILNIYSKSERIKNLLDDLFVNKLQIHTTLPLITRTMCKYGNDYHLLNIQKDAGVVGWRQLPVYDMERSDGNYSDTYSNYNATTYQLNGNTTQGVTFRWLGHNDDAPYKAWQVAHFRLLIDSQFLPYGTSILSKSRRHWRMLTMMEDMMLIYRLERSIERRVFKINVGNIDTADVTAYVQNMANTLKRNPIVDPTTGQLDYRRSVLGVDMDYFVPVLNANDANPIETLPAAQNISAIDDIKFVQNKVLTGLEVPKAFIGFDETVGDGKNLALMDVRFARRINRIQQFTIMELNKIAMIHLYILGFRDDINNFTITMNNPSTQAELLKIDELQKKITAVKDAITDVGNGIPVMSWKRALKEIMKMSEEEIMENLNEIRMESALAVELKKTAQIIKRTGVFDPVDKIYGDPTAQYQEGMPDENGDMGGGSFGGGGDFEMGSGDFDTSGEGEITGEEGEMDISTEGEVGGSETPQQQVENLNREVTKLSKKVTLNENAKRIHRNNKYYNMYLGYLQEEVKKREGLEQEVVNKGTDKILEGTSSTDNAIKELDKLI